MLTHALQGVFAPSAQHPEKIDKRIGVKPNVSVLPFTKNAQATTTRIYAVRMISSIESIRTTQPNNEQRWTSERLARVLPGNAYRRFLELTLDQKAKVVQLANAYPTERPGQVPQALVDLIASGKLTSQDKKGGTLLDSLAKLSVQELGGGLNRGQLVKELVERIMQPEKISQRNKGTCTVTSMEYLLASKNPAEFARIVTGLVSKEGSVTLADGSTLNRDGGCLGDDKSGRAAIDRIFQASFMEHLNGWYRNYNNETDEHELIGLMDEGSGLADDDLDDGIDSVFGRNYAVHSYKDSEKARPKLIGRLKAALKDGHRILFTMRWSKDEDGKHGYHKVVLTGIGEERVELWNPWGDGEQNQTAEPPRQLNRQRGAGHITMALDDFFSRASGYHLPPGY